MIGESKSEFQSREPRNKVLGIGIFNHEVNRQDRDIAADIMVNLSGFHDQDVNLIRETLRNYRLEILQKARVIE